MLRYGTVRPQGAFVLLFHYESNDQRLDDAAEFTSLMFPPCTRKPENKANQAAQGKLGVCLWNANGEDDQLTGIEGQRKEVVRPQMIWLGTEGEIKGR